MLIFDTNKVKQSLWLFIKLGLIVGLISSCSVFNRFFPDKRLNYQQHEAKSELSIPEDMQTSKIKDSMPVPEIADSLTKLPLPEEVTRPAPLKFGLIHQGVQKRSLGEQLSLFVDKSPSQVWPELVRYFEERSFPVNQSLPQLGVLESGFVGKDNASLNEVLMQFQQDGKFSGIDVIPDHRFRVLLEPALQRNTSHLKILVSQQESLWPEKSDSLLLEELLLDDLANFVGTKLENKSSVSLLAQQMQRKFEATIRTEESGAVYLYINQDFNQSWVLLGKSIRQVGLPLYDLNRSLGLYYFSLAHEDSRSFAFSKKLDAYKKLENHADFQIYVLEEDTGTVATVQLANDQAADKDFARTVLSALLEQIKEN